MTQLTDLTPSSSASSSSSHRGLPTWGEPAAQPGDGLPVVMVLDDDVTARRRIARALAPRAIVRPVGSAEAARSLLERAPIAGLVLELELPGGSGLELLEELRQRGSRLPALVVSGTQSVTEVSRASRLGASFVSKAEEFDDIRGSVLWLAEAARAFRDSRDGLARRLASTHRLTRAEEQTLLAFVQTGRRDDLAERFGVAETSMKSRVRGVCRKLDIPRIEAVFRVLFEMALERG